MSLSYDFFQVKEINSTEEGKYRARAVYRGKIDTEKLARWINQKHGISMALAKSVMMLLSDAVLDYVSDGYEVQVGDFGYFSASVTSKLVDSATEIRAESVHFNRLNFRASSKTRKLLRNAGVEKVSNPRNSKKLPQTTRKQRAEKLKKYFSSGKAFITRADYMRVTAVMRKNAAVDDLNAFVGEGWLQRHGVGRTVIYMMRNR